VIGRQCACDIPEMGYQDGCDRGKLLHVTLHEKLDQKWRALRGLFPLVCERSAGRDIGVNAWRASEFREARARAPSAAVSN
jgi:hypothetical protein